MTRPTPIIVGTLAALLLLFGAYMGAYYAMVKETPVIGGGSLMERVVIYRVDNRTVRTMFRPAHNLDRLIRHDYFTVVDDNNS